MLDVSSPQPIFRLRRSRRSAAAAPDHRGALFVRHPVGTRERPFFLRRPAFRAAPSKFDFWRLAGPATDLPGEYFLMAKIRLAAKQRVAE